MANLDLNKDKPKLKPLVNKEEVKEEKIENKSIKGGTKPYADFIGYLLNCSKMARVFAIITKNYATHKIMGHYECDIKEHIYCLSKQLTIEFGDLKGFGKYTIEEYENMNPEEYFEDAKKYIEDIRNGLLKDAPKEVTSEINHILKVTNSTLYHLKMTI